jgi:hypothetical protein
MEHHVTLGEFAVLLAVLWLPLFSIIAIFHCLLLRGWRWRAAWVTAIFTLGNILALVILFSPISSSLLFLGSFGSFLAIGGTPIQAAILSALVTTFAVLVLVRLGPSPNNSFKAKPLRGSP